MDKDLFDDFEPGHKAAPSAPLQSVQMGRAAPKTTPEQRKRALSSEIGHATKTRRAWEASPEGKARSRDIVDLATEQHNQLAAQHPDKLKPSKRLGLTRAQVYQHLGVTNEGHGHGDQQLPGFENPHSAPEPPRWEDLSPEHRAKTEQNMRRAGTNLDKMKEDFGNQLDQAVWRAHTAGHHRASTGEPIPFTSHFYGEHPGDAPEPLDRPKAMMRESREHLASQGIHVDPSVHTAVVGHVSPNVKFTQGERGKRTSPNIEAAESVFDQRNQGLHHSEVSSGVNRQGKRNQTRPANARRAAIMLEQIEHGTLLAESRNPPSASNPKGSSQWGPKTGPFANSFDASKPDFFVGDVHSFGGGMLPHLGTTKPIARNAAGGRDRIKMFKEDPRSDAEILQHHRERDVFRSDKSAREKAMVTMGTAIPGSEGKKVTAHSAVDYAARQAISERGLGTSVRRPQAAQWGEEQLQRGVASPKLDVPHHEEAYPSQKAPVNPNQMKLFT
jgi:hypothetical protein